MAKRWVSQFWKVPIFHTCHVQLHQSFFHIICMYSFVKPLNKLLSLYVDSNTKAILSYIEFLVLRPQVQDNSSTFSVSEWPLVNSKCLWPWFEYSNFKIA